MITAKKVISIVTSVTSAIAISAVGLAGSALAAPLTQASATLSDSRSLVASDHTIQFNVGSTTNVKGIKFQYRIAPSGTSTVPSGLVTSSATLPGASNDTITVNSSPSTGWSAGVGTPGTVLVTNSSGTGSLTIGNTISVELDNITNNDATASGGGTQCDAVANSETCYIIVTTYSDTGATTPIDTTTVSYTVISPITVTATVDPSLTLTVTGVTTAATVQSDDSNSNCGSSADVAATATSIPFGNIKVATPVCAQQTLSVATNAQYGYTVDFKFIGASASANMMQGNNTSNNIDPYTSAWGSATSMGTPSGTAANVNSGWLGIRVKNPGSMSPGVSGFGTSNYYAGPEVNNTATFSDAVMNSSGPDSGASPTYLTYKLITNALQPSDTYSGTAVLAAIAKY
jgi:hypothetical protein